MFIQTRGREVCRGMRLISGLSTVGKGTYIRSMLSVRYFWMEPSTYTKRGIWMMGPFDPWCPKPFPKSLVLTFSHSSLFKLCCSRLAWENFNQFISMRHRLVKQLSQQQIEAPNRAISNIKSYSTSQPKIANQESSTTAEKAPHYILHPININTNPAQKRKNPL